MPVADEAYASNPKDIMGTRKTPFSTLSMPVMARMAVSMYEGARKYGRHNYRVVGVKASIYYDAFIRHVSAWYEGEDIDPESGEHHLVKAMTCLMVYLDAEMRGMVVDDRPPKTIGFLKDTDNKIQALNQKYPTPIAPFTERGQQESKNEAIRDDYNKRLAELCSPPSVEYQWEGEQGNNLEPNSCCVSGVPIRSERVSPEGEEADGLSDCQGSCFGVSTEALLLEIFRRSVPTDTCN
jgi:hypothetical protein